MVTHLDHLVVTAPTLDAGVHWIEDQFGCSMSPGGQHLRMGTHNALVKIGPRQYLEVIAIDPSLEPPNRNRWFGLDRLKPTHSPEFCTWVARTPNIADDLRSGLWPRDAVTTMARETFEWTITIPTDDDWFRNRHLPLLIQWGDSRHPTDRLPDAGVTLKRLAIVDRQPDIATSRLQTMGFSDSDLVVVEQGVSRQLVAEFETPRGFVVLRSSSIVILE